MDFNNYEYVVKVDGKEFRSECNYGGYMECLKFIHDNDTSYEPEKKRYKIKMVKKEVR